MALDKGNIEYVVYDKTVPNPTMSNIEEAKELYVSHALEGIIAFTLAPLYAIVKLGIALMVLDFIAVITLAILCIFDINLFVSWVILLLAITFLVALLIVCLGIISIYQAKIYSEVKNRPIYIAKETNVK